MDRPAVMAEDPEKSYQVAFEVRKVGGIRAVALARNSLVAFRGCPDLPEIDTWEKVVEQTEGFWGDECLSASGRMMRNPRNHHTQ